MYDIIGDIHGHADALVELLTLLGYERIGGTFAHPERKIIFLGDFIDRGPKIREVLQIVRPMIDEGKALAVMGNHELNALAYHTPDADRPGDFLRSHNEKTFHHHPESLDEKNYKQHRHTVDQVPPNELASYLKWFRTLPMWLDLDGLRVVHACWDTQAVQVVRDALGRHHGITDSFLQLACKKDNPLFTSVEILLKGKEVKLPDGISFKDADGHVRSDIRTRWYLPTVGQTVRTYAFQSDEVDCDVNVETIAKAAAEPYPATAKPVFIGHYWLTAENPSILAGNVACVDYSIAKKGFLCAYQWNGEQKLSNDHFAWVSIENLAVYINQTYEPGMNLDDLYECTRGIWPLDRSRAEETRYVFAVYQGVIVGVFEYGQWYPAGMTTYRWRTFTAEELKDRYEFVGQPASAEVRQKYVGEPMLKSTGGSFRYVTLVHPSMESFRFQPSTRSCG